MQSRARFMQLCTLDFWPYAPRVFVEYIPAHAQNIPKLEYYSNPRLCMFRQAMLSESITGQEFSL
jgi:hypothetical protein